ncbi:MAG: hypothetical protein KIT33_15520 [Candidatus Kapabacteria bacterium]|nr:hypothetical protein [Ignavibacteriota bacterium]MCW5886379.1 hypothetical protein [Candidatus Kapabacteria bacterium]
MKAIDTYFNCNYHRSRLEARWAVFFKALGIKYQYEPEGFVSANGSKYLPDFYLPETTLRGKSKGVYIEIKHQNYDKEYNVFENTISKWFTEPLVMFCGYPFQHIWGNWDDIQENGYQLVPPIDTYMLFWICNKCGHSKIEYMEGSYDECPICDGVGDSKKLMAAAHEAIVKRFEYDSFNTNINQRE